MNNTLNITVDGEALTVPEGISVAAALALTGDPTTRQAVNGDPRAPFCCGMGSARVPDHRRRPAGAGLPDPVPGRHANRKEPLCTRCAVTFNPRRRPRRHGGRALCRRLQ